MLISFVDFRSKGLMWNSVKTYMENLYQDAPKAWQRYIEMFLYKHLRYNFFGTVFGTASRKVHKNEKCLEFNSKYLKNFVNNIKTSCNV